MDDVLVLAGIVLVFSGSWEGTQLGWLTQTGQGDIRYHAMSCSVYNWESWLGGDRDCGLGAGWASGFWVVRNCIVHHSHCVMSIIVIFFSFSAVLLNCLYPNPQVLPYSSNSAPHPTGTGGRSEQAATWYLVAGWG